MIIMWGFVGIVLILDFILVYSLGVTVGLI